VTISGPSTESPDEPEGVAGEQVVVRSQGTPGLALGEQSVEEAESSVSELLAACRQSQEARALLVEEGGLGSRVRALRGGRTTLRVGSASPGL